MNPTDVRLRQQLLLIRSTELRQALHNDLQNLQRPAAWVDHLRTALAWLCQHPQWPTAGLALLLILKPSRFLAWGAKLWWLWKSARQLRHWRNALLLGLRQR